MGRLLATLRSGAWLTRKRVQLWAAAVLVASMAGLLYLVATSDGRNDAFGRPLGTDFSNVYAAGTYVLDGAPTEPFDPARQHARERQIFGEATPFYGWHYPPFFLFIAAALALLPYLPALLIWQATTLVLYLAMMRAILTRLQPTAPDRLWLLAALAFPAVLVNVGHGHNGFLTAALIGCAFLWLERRPALAGLLFGLLAYKPQFGLMIPLVLAATGRWRAFAAAAATVAALAAVTTWAFGLEVWGAFLTSTEYSRVVVLEAGDTGWHKIQSVFSSVRMWGGPVWLAYLLQGIVTVAVAATLIRLWRSSAAFALKAAGFACACLLATPYVLDYDLMVLAVAIAFFAAHGLAHGFGEDEVTLLAAAWMMPLVARTLGATIALPLGPIVLLALYALTLRRAAGATAVSGRESLVPA